MPAPRVLVLDCGGVTNPDCEPGLGGVADAMGVGIEDARRGHKAAWAKSRANPVEQGYWETVFEVAGVPDADRTPDRVSACEAALAVALRKCFPETLEVTRRLKAECNVTIGIISNHLVTPNLFGYCAEGAGLDALVSDPSLLVVSQAVGLGKPDPAIFRLFIDRLRILDPSMTVADCLFVDDKAANVDAAIADGWHGLVFNAGTATPGAFAREVAVYGLK